MKATIRKRADNSLEIYIPKKDLEAVVIKTEGTEGKWGGIFELANGLKIQVPYFDNEPKLPITLEVRKVE